MYPSSVNSCGMMCIGSVSVSMVVLKLLDSIQTYGSTMIIDTMSSMQNMSSLFLKSLPPMISFMTNTPNPLY